MIHKVTNDTSQYNCNCCSTLFQSLKAFKRHMKKHFADGDQKSDQNIDDNLPLFNVEPTDLPCPASCSKETALPHTTTEKCMPNTNTDKYNNRIILFVLMILGQTNVTRKLAYSVFNMVNELVIDPLIQIARDTLDQQEINESKTIIDRMMDFKKIYSSFITEYKCKQFLLANDLFTEPTTFTINSSSSIDEIDCKHTGVLFPLKDNLRRFFQLPNILSSMKEKLAFSCASIVNICSGLVWKDKVKSYGDKTVVPYILYQDDYEINNPLGSKSGNQKISAFYLSFPLLEVNTASKLKNVFVACITKSISLRFGQSYNFNMLVTVLRELEQTGIEITINGITEHVYFIMAAFTGDNLGLNTVMGFAKSFAANYFCRICKTHKDTAKTLTRENITSLRNEKNYSSDLLAENVSETGIKETSVLSNISSFKITDNVTVDIMHDLFEGICHVELSHFLKYFIYDKKFFTLEMFNHRKKTFNYPHCDSRNKSVDITLNHLNNYKLKMSASQMICFVHYLPFIIGDMIPNNDPVYNCLRLLNKLIHFSCKEYFEESCLIEFEDVIHKHHSLYLKLFNTSLTPKHHFILHYPSVIKKLGPLKQLWTMRFEAKHKQAKAYMNVTSSRKNVLMSIATKFQLNFAFNLYNTCHSEVVQTDSGKIKNLAFELCDISFTGNIENNFSEVETFDKVVINNTEYRVSDVVGTHGNNMLELYSVVYILRIDNSFYFVGENLKILSFNEHYGAYDVLTTDMKKFLVKNVNIPPTAIFKIGGTNFVKIKPYFRFV